MVVRISRLSVNRTDLGLDFESMSSMVAAGAVRIPPHRLAEWKAGGELRYNRWEEEGFEEEQEDTGMPSTGTAAVKRPEARNQVWVPKEKKVDHPCMRK